MNSQLVLDTFNHFNSNKVSYCHFKSNAFINRTILGKNDIDVLVDEKDHDLVLDIISSLGYIKTKLPKNKRNKYIFSYIASCNSSGKLIHLHLHLKLITGGKFFKNYNLKCEEEMLSNAVYLDNIKIADPNDEIILLLIRSILKVDFIDFLRKNLKGKKSFFPKNINDEFDYLLSKINKKDMLNSIERIGINISENQIIDYVNKIKDYQFQNKDLLILKRINKKYLKNKIINKIPFYNLTMNIKKYFSFAKKRLIKKSKTSEKTIDSYSGVSIAFWGMDGAGKSTVSNIIYSWISKELKVQHFYGGSGDGKLNFTINLIKKIKQKISKVEKLKTDSHLQKKAKKSKFGFVHTVRSLLVAFDKRKKIKTAVKLQNNGVVTLFDRFPQDIVRGINDGPKIKRNKYNAIFYNMEKNIYKKFNNNKPDVNIFLKVDCDTAISRKPDHDLSILIEKAGVLENIVNNYGKEFITIDATLPLDEVLSQVKNNLWKIFSSQK